MRRDSIERKDDCEDINWQRADSIPTAIEEAIEASNGAFHINDQTYTSKTDGDKVTATFGGPFGYLSSLYRKLWIGTYMGLGVGQKNVPMTYSWYMKVHQIP